jgi:hypothetical protein
MLLLWNNADLSGAPNPLTLHEGCAVEAGAKYVVTKWYRERFWLGSGPHASANPPALLNPVAMAHKA